MRIQTGAGGVRQLWQTNLAPQQLGLAWLGQAGFALRLAAARVLIDPYLSDSLAAKYKGTVYPHIRMMQPPILPNELHDLDHVLCTHRHSDHMDPGTLPVLAGANPSCRFIVPAAEQEAAIGAGIPANRLDPVNAGDIITLAPKLRLEPVPAAHEQLQRNARGEHHFLGFILSFAGIRVYHSGDCVPFDGLPDLLRGRVDLALLPVNGRDATRQSRGVPGNFTFEEARDLCIAAGIPDMIAHHFGMFDFNTLPQEELESKAATAVGVGCLLPRLNRWFLMEE